MAKLLIVFLFSWSLLFYHSCMPCGDQRQVLSLSRAEDDLIRDYTESFYVQPLFQSATKRCPHCGRLVEVNVSVGECMFKELMSEPENSPRVMTLFKATRKQLRGEATDGYGPANFLLGMIAENGMFQTRQDILEAARRYRLFADTGAPQGRAALACFWIRIGENLTAAENLLKKVLEEDPRNTDCYMYLSQAYSLMGRHKEAFESAKKAYYHSPVNSEERHAIEMIFVEKLMIAAQEIGRDAAFSQINDMIYISPSDMDLVFARANLHALFGEFANAEKELNNLEKSYPSIPLRIARARVRAAQNNVAGANQDMNALLTDNPKNFVVRGAVLELLLARKKEKEAFDMVNKFIEEDADKTSAYLLRANLQLAAKNLPAAIADFELAKKSAPPEGVPDIEAAIHSLKESIRQQEEGLPPIPEESF